MFSPIYLMRSRHQVYYFRWPLPKTPHSPKPDHIRLSLRTREPREALRLARTLEYHARLIIDTWGEGLMNNTEAKAIIHAYFQNILQKRKDRIIEDGPLADERLSQIERTIKDAEEWIELAKGGAELEDDDTIERVNQAMKLDIDPSSTDAEKIKANYNLAYPAMLREVLRFNEEQSSFNFAPQKHSTQSRPQKKHTLDEICQKFVDMHMRDKQWDENTRKEKLVYSSTRTWPDGCQKNKAVTGRCFINPGGIRRFDRMGACTCPHFSLPSPQISLESGRLRP